MSTLISSSKLINVLDRLASIYSRANPVLGTSNEYNISDLNGSITSSSSSLTLDSPISGTWTTLLPPAGLLMIDNEEIVYSNVNGNVITLATRGYNNTLPSSHADEATVYLPASCGKYAELGLVDIVGDDTSTNFGVGAPNYQVIADLSSMLNRQISNVKATGYFSQIAQPYFSIINSHVAKNGPTNCALTPSFVTSGTFTVSDVVTYLRYLNDKTSGTVYSALCAWQTAYLYWLTNSGNLLDGKTVFAPYNQFYQGVVTGTTTATWTFGANLLRTGTPDLTLTTWTQGYSAVPLRARVTAASSGTTTITCASCQGQDGISGDYFGTVSDTLSAVRSVSGTLDMSAVNNVMALTNGNGDRVHAITATPTLSGTATTGTFIIENDWTVPRIIP